jgi:hypothetical protein
MFFHRIIYCACVLGSCLRPCILIIDRLAQFKSRASNTVLSYSNHRFEYRSDCFFLYLLFSIVLRQVASIRTCLVRLFPKFLSLRWVFKDRSKRYFGALNTLILIVRLLARGFQTRRVTLGLDFLVFFWRASSIPQTTTFLAWLEGGIQVHKMFIVGLVEKLTKVWRRVRPIY